MQRNAKLSFCVPVRQLKHQIGNALGGIAHAGGAHIVRHLRKLCGVCEQVADEVIQVVRRERPFEQHLCAAGALEHARVALLMVVRDVRRRDEHGGACRCT